MAPSGSHEKDPLRNCTVLQDIDGDISRILQQLSCKSKQDVIKDLVENVDIKDLKECRKELYKSCVGVYDEQLEENGVAGKANIQLINRRGESTAAHVKCAEDIVHMMLYVCGLAEMAN